MAVQWIGSLSDAELLDYLPQLVQVGGMPALRFWGPTLQFPCGLHAAPQDQVETMVGVGDWQSLEPHSPSQTGPEVRVLPGQPLGALPAKTGRL